MFEGRCECGGVQFEFEEARPSITVCHCSQCRRVSGHLWASTKARFEDVRFLSDATLRWYESSDFAKRGFCGTCGASLFYRMNDEEGIGIAAGCLTHTEGLAVGKHIFVKDEGDYHEIAEAEPQIARY